MIGKFSNSRAEAMIADMQPLLSRRDKCGYVAARNTRILSDALTEYLTFKGDLIRRYGTESGDGRGIIEILPSAPNFHEFITELNKIASIEHEVNLMTLKYDEVIGLLSGEEILALDWMLEE